MEYSGMVSRKDEEWMDDTRRLRIRMTSTLLIN